MNGRVEPNPIMPVGNGNGGTTTTGTKPARDRKAEIRERAQSMADTRKDQLVNRIESVSDAFRKTGEQLKTDEQQELSRYVEMIGDRVSRIAQYLRVRDARELTHDVENFARRQPAVFLGGAFAIGFLAARFLKSSAEHPSETMLEPESTGVAPHY